MCFAAGGQAVEAGAAGCRGRELHLAHGAGGPVSETDVALLLFLPLSFFLITLRAISTRGRVKTPRPPYVVTSPVSVGTKVYGDGRGKHVISVQAGRHSHGWYAALTHTHTYTKTPTRRPRLCPPRADAPACVVQGLMSRVRGVFPSLPPWAGWLLTTCTQPPPTTM